MAARERKGFGDMAIWKGKGRGEGAVAYKARAL
jgi:hypothetical protein